MWLHRVSNVIYNLIPYLLTFISVTWRGKGPSTCVFRLGGSSTCCFLKFRAFGGLRELVQPLFFCFWGDFFFCFFTFESPNHGWNDSLGRTECFFCWRRDLLRIHEGTCEFEDVNTIFESIMQHSLHINGNDWCFWGWVPDDCSLLNSY